MSHPEQRQSAFRADSEPDMELRACSNVIYVSRGDRFDDDRRLGRQTVSAGMRLTRVDWLRGTSQRFRSCWPFASRT